MISLDHEIDEELLWGKCSGSFVSLSGEWYLHRVFTEAKNS